MDSCADLHFGDTRAQILFIKESDVSLKYSSPTEICTQITEFKVVVEPDFVLLVCV